jgi:uncharacterized oxidoreductase
MRTTDNTVLITGGTSGIGHALAAQLLARGNTVIITGRSEERLAQARLSLPGVHTLVCDQSDPHAITRACDAVTRRFPTLNVLINNAGIGLRRNLNDTLTPPTDLEQEIRTNLIGPMQMVHQLLPHLKAQTGAVIVNVTSGLAFVPMPLKPVYCATKAAMHSYTQSLRVQLKRCSIKVIELAPPATATAFNTGQETMNASRLMDVDKFAREAIRGFEKGRDEVLPGLSRLIRLIGRLNPRATLRTADAERMGSEGGN